MSNSRSSAPDRVRLPTGAEVPEEIRRELVDQVRERMLAGELDSDLALVETALALLDGDFQNQP